MVDTAGTGCYSFPHLILSCERRAAQGRLESLLFHSARRGGSLVVLIRNQLSEHLPWLVACLVVTAISGAWFALACAGQAAYPSGSSFPGFTFGVLGGV